MLDAPTLFSRLRKGINDFVNTNNSKFDAYKPEDGDKWQSDNPLGAAINIKINTLNQLAPSLEVPWWLPLPDAIDEALVGCSAYKHGETWTFTTLRTTTLAEGVFGPAGHPVSGNRMWGLSRRDDHWVFYTRGADRATSWLDHAGNVVANMVWDGADALWRSLQQRVADFINRHEGEAEVVSPRFSERFPWPQVQQLLRASATSQDT